MRDALRFEWVRLRTVRSTYWLIASGLAINAASAFLVGYITRNDPPDNETVGIGMTGGGANLPIPMAAMFIATIGILATGHEYRYGTIQPTLTAIPRRSIVLAAKMVTVAVVAAGFAVVSMALNLGAAMIFWEDVPDLTAPPLDGALPGYLVLVVLWAGLGTALGQLFRSVPSPLVTILAVPMIVEQLIFRLSYVPALDWLAPAVKFLPFLAGQRLANLIGEAAGTDGIERGMFDRWPSGGIFAAFVALTVAIAWTMFKRRDA